MKFILAIAAVSAFVQTPAFAANQVYTGEVEYTKPGWDSRWSSLEQLGIERAAEKRAYSMCVRDGATDCVILEGAAVTACGYMPGGPEASGCKATAYSRGTK